MGIYLWNWRGSRRTGCVWLVSRRVLQHRDKAGCWNPTISDQVQWQDGVSSIAVFWKERKGSLFYYWSLTNWVCSVLSHWKCYGWSCLCSSPLLPSRKDLVAFGVVRSGKEGCCPAIIFIDWSLRVHLLSWCFCRDCRFVAFIDFWGWWEKGIVLRARYRLSLRCSRLNFTRSWRWGGIICWRSSLYAKFCLDGFLVFSFSAD